MNIQHLYAHKGLLKVTLLTWFSITLKQKPKMYIVSVILYTELKEVVLYNVCISISSVLWKKSNQKINAHQMPAKSEQVITILDK